VWFRAVNGEQRQGHRPAVIAECRNRRCRCPAITINLDLPELHQCSRIIIKLGLVSKAEKLSALAIGIDNVRGLKNSFKVIL